MNSREHKIKLPPELVGFFEATGYTESTLFESRRNARLRVRAAADLSILKMLPSIPRKELEFGVLVKDVSQRGISFIAHKQLFPEECVTIQFNSRVFELRIVRCRRLNELCYECGAEVQAFRNLEEETA